MNFHKLMYDIQMSTTSPSTADIYIYSEINSDTTDWFGDKIQSETSANTFRQKLDELGNVKNINLYINSNGGSCQEGNAIYSMLRRHPAYITAYIDGFACSEASVIPMACDKVVMQDNAVMMLHNPWMMVCGNAKELREQADTLDTMSKAFRQAYLNRFKGTEQELCNLLDAETWLTAQECVKYGLADEISGFTSPNPTQEKEEPTQAKEIKFNQIDNTMNVLKNLVNNQII